MGSFAQLPLLERCAIIGAGAGGVAGGIAGLVIGLSVHPPTAWFAILEAGIPASIAGGVLGLLLGVLLKAVRRVSGGDAQRPNQRIDGVERE